VTQVTAIYDAIDARPPLDDDELRALTTRLVNDGNVVLGLNDALIGTGAVFDMDPRLARGIALRYADDASTALMDHDPATAADHLANAYLAALAIGPVDSPEVRAVTAILERVATAWARGGDAA
jgi:hypothetical protein